MALDAVRCGTLMIGGDFRINRVGFGIDENVAAADIPLTDQEFAVLDGVEFRKMKASA